MQSSDALTASSLARADSVGPSGGGVVRATGGAGPAPRWGARRPAGRGHSRIAPRVAHATLLAASLGFLAAACGRSTAPVERVEPAEVPAGVGPATSPSPGEPAQAQAPAPPLLRRVSVLGASASAGFGLKSPRGGMVEMAEILAAALGPAAGEVADHSALAFFLNAEQNGPRAVDAALADDPTLVVAIDFLFWFAYGVRLSEERHLERFERGLAQLERLDCPLLVGDIPDVSHALESDVRMLLPSQVPEPEVLAALNARLANWASARPDVRLVPMAEFVARTVAGERVELRGNLFDDAADGLLQLDRLHPTLLGAVGLGLLALDVIEREHEQVQAGMVRWDARELVSELGG